MIYRTMQQSVLICNAETWTLKEEHKRKLHVFDMLVMRKIMGLSRKGKRRNADFRKMLNIDMDTVKVIQNRRLSHFGPVVRMNSGHYCMDMSMGPDRKEDQEN